LSASSRCPERKKIMNSERKILDNETRAMVDKKFPLPPKQEEDCRRSTSSFPSRSVAQEAAERPRRSETYVRARGVVSGHCADNRSGLSWRPWRQRRHSTRRKNIMSFIADRHSNPRHPSGFKPPPSKSIGSDFIENRITCALRHHRATNFAARPINDQIANATANDIGQLRLVGIPGQRGANCHSFCS
jgi:hypothetical protein